MHRFRKDSRNQPFMVPLHSWEGPVTSLPSALVKKDVFTKIETLRSDNGDGDGDGDGNVRSLGRAGPHRVGVPAKIEITNFTSENVDDGHWCLSCLSQRKFFRKPCQSSVTLFSWLMLPVWLTLKNSCFSTILCFVFVFDSVINIAIFAVSEFVDITVQPSQWVPCKIRLIYDYKWKLAQWKYLYTLHRSNLVPLPTKSLYYFLVNPK